MRAIVYTVGLYRGNDQGTQSLQSVLIIEVLYRCYAWFHLSYTLEVIATIEDYRNNDSTTILETTLRK